MQIGGKKGKEKMSRMEVLLCTSELADLLEAGMTLGQALQALSNQGDEASGQRYVCRDLCDRSVRGDTGHAKRRSAVSASTSLRSSAHR